MAKPATPAPKLALKLAADTGLSATDGITSNGAILATKAASTDVLTYRMSSDGGLTWTAWAKTSGTLPAPAADGTWLVQVQEKTTKGKLVATATLSFTLDTSAPAPTLTLVNDTGAAGDGVTASGAVSASGLESGARLQYSTDGGKTWAAAFSALEGNNLVMARQVDVAGNVSAATSLAFTLDSSALAPTLALADDSGEAGDAITATGAVAVSGLEAGATVAYSADGGVTWAASFAPQEGDNLVMARQTDLAGNVSAAATIAFTLDTSAPQALDDAAETLQDTAVLLDVLGNDTDNGSFVLAGTGSAGYGVVVDNGDGTLAYTPEPGFTGTDTFTYSVVDAAGNVATASVQVTVNPLPVDPPVDPPVDTTPFVALDPATVTGSVVIGALLAANAGIEVDPGSVVWHASGSSSTNLYDGSLAPLGMGAGLLLTSGTTPGTANTVQWYGVDNGTEWGTPGFDNGDADLDAVVNTVFSTVSYDATTLSFEFTVLDPAATSVSFDLVFGSDEFPEWVDQFVDVAVVIVNGQNVALFDHDAMHPLSVIGSNLAGNYFIDNGAGVLPIEYDGVSARLKIVAPVQPGTNTIKIGIGDTGDHVYDSGVFLANFAAGNLPGSGVLIDDDSGTSGDDNSTGGAGNDLIDSGDGNDSLAGGGGDDVVVGGGGDDVVSGGTGSDQLAGGTGSDEFDYSDTGDWASDGLDTIVDFAGNAAALDNASNTDAIDGDVLVFSSAVLASLPGAVTDGFTAPEADSFSTLGADDLSLRTDGLADQPHAQFTYDSATGIVSFDPDGTGSAEALQVTLLGTKPDHLETTWFVLAG